MKNGNLMLLIFKIVKSVHSQMSQTLDTRDECALHW